MGVRKIKNFSGGNLFNMLESSGVGADEPSRSPSSESISVTSNFKAKDFYSLLYKNLLDNTDNIKFKYKVSDRIDAHGNVVEGKKLTGKPKKYLQLDTQKIYINISPDKWVYIYIPEVSEDGSYYYIEHKDTSGNTYYKGNHVSIKYSDKCDIIMFHYTEYNGDDFNKSYNHCNFKVEDFDFSDIQCAECVESTVNQTVIKTGQTFKNKPGVNAITIKKYSDVFDIMYKIIKLIRGSSKEKKVATKQEKKFRKEQEALREKAQENKKTQEDVDAANKAAIALQLKKVEELSKTPEQLDNEKKARKAELAAQSRKERDERKAIEKAQEEAAKIEHERKERLFQRQVTNEENANKDAEQVANARLKKIKAQKESSTVFEEITKKAAEKKAKEEAKAAEKAAKAAEKALLTQQKGGIKKIRRINKNNK
jgi:hypothetical protein